MGSTGHGFQAVRHGFCPSTGAGFGAPCWLRLSVFLVAPSLGVPISMVVVGKQFTFLLIVV